MSLLLLAYPGYLGFRAYQLPQIYDVTTDPYDPPRFEAVARLRTREANPVAYAGLATYEQQRAAYPDVEPLIAAATPQAAYDAARAVVTKRKWRVVDERAPQAGRRDPRRPTPDGSVIDIRSASRYGFHDFGANAARVASLIEDIEDVATPDKTELPVKKAPKTGPAAAKTTAQPAARR